MKRLLAALLAATFLISPSATCDRSVKKCLTLFHALRAKEFAETGLEEQLSQSLRSPDDLVRAAGRLASTALGLTPVVVHPELSRRAGLEEQGEWAWFVGPVAPERLPDLLLEAVYKTAADEPRETGPLNFWVWVDDDPEGMMVIEFTVDRQFARERTPAFLRAGEDFLTLRLSQAGIRFEENVRWVLTYIGPVVKSTSSTRAFRLHRPAEERFLLTLSPLRPQELERAVPTPYGKESLSIYLDRLVSLYAVLGGTTVVELVDSQGQTFSVTLENGQSQRRVAALVRQLRDFLKQIGHDGSFASAISDRRIDSEGEHARRIVLTLESAAGLEEWRDYLKAMYQMWMGVSQQMRQEYERREPGSTEPPVASLPDALLSVLEEVLNRIHQLAPDDADAIRGAQERFQKIWIDYVYILTGEKGDAATMASKLDQLRGDPQWSSEHIIRSIAVGEVLDKFRSNAPRYLWDFRLISADHRFKYGMGKPSKAAAISESLDQMDEIMDAALEGIVRRVAEVVDYPDEITAGLEEDEIKQSLIELARRELPRFLPYSRMNPQNGLYREWLMRMLDRSPWVWISSGFLNPDSPPGGTLDVYSHVPKFKVTEFEVLEAGWIKLEIPLNPEQGPVLQWRGSSSVFQPPGLKIPARRIFPALDWWNSQFSKVFLMDLLQQNRKARREVSGAGEFSSDEIARQAVLLQQEWLDREPQPITEADFPLPIGSLLVDAELFFEGSLLLTDVWLVTGIEPSSLSSGSPYLLTRRLDQPSWRLSDLKGVRHAQALRNMEPPLKGPRQKVPPERSSQRVLLHEGALRSFFYIPPVPSASAGAEKTDPIRSGHLPALGKIVVPDARWPGIRGVVSASRSEGVELTPVDPNGDPISGAKPQFFSKEQLLRGQAGVLLPPLNDPEAGTVLVSSSDTRVIPSPAAGLEQMGRPDVPSYRRAVLFGAGNIGRGHLAPLLAEDDFDLFFADVSEKIIAEANSRESYTVTPVGGGQSVTVRNFWGLDVRNEQSIADLGPLADWMFTSVGVNNIPRLKSVIHRFIKQRLQAEHREVLNIVFAENLPVDQPQIAALRAAVLELAEQDPDLHRYIETQVNFIGSGQVYGDWDGYLDYVQKDVGWVGAVVNITVPETIAAASENPLDVRVEGGGPYYLEVDAQELRNTPRLPAAIRPVQNIRAAREKKLLIHNMGHAMLAYLSAALGIQDPADGIWNPHVRAVVRRAMLESAQGMNHQYRELFPLPALEAYVDGLIDRFGNKELNDTMERIGRDPMRKLAENDRLFGAAAMARQAGVSPEAIGLGIAAAVFYAERVSRIPPETFAPVLQRAEEMGLKLPRDQQTFEQELNRLTAAGLEEGIQIKTIADLREMGDEVATALADQLEKENAENTLGRTQKTGVVLMPREAVARHGVKLDSRSVTVYAHQEVYEAVVDLLPTDWQLSSKWKSYPLDSNPEVANKDLALASSMAQEQGQTLVVGLNVDHPVEALNLSGLSGIKILLDPRTVSRWNHDERVRVRAFLNRPDALMNVILDLASGFVPTVTLDDGRQYYALEIAA